MGAGVATSGMAGNNGSSNASSSAASARGTNTRRGAMQVAPPFNRKP